jgi:hypothetical protein
MINNPAFYLSQDSIIIRQYVRYIAFHVRIPDILKSNKENNTKSALTLCPTEQAQKTTIKESFKSPPNSHWRRGWDSNPRDRSARPTRFRVERLHPLGHLSSF